MKSPACYSDLTQDCYNLASLLVIAKRTRRYGNRQGDRREGFWWIDADQAGVKMRRAVFFATETRSNIPTHQWLPVGEGLEINIDSSCRADYPGRFMVRRSR